jgi:hypothetical protein
MNQIASRQQNTSKPVVVWMIIFAKLSIDVGRSHAGDVGDKQGDQFRRDILEDLVTGL